LDDWKDRRVGWGLVLPEALLPVFSGPPDPIRRLLKARGDAPVFRYLGDSHERRLDSLLRDSTGKLVAIEGTPPGAAEDCLPQYLLIYGSPEKIPWSLQYVLAQNRFVGRLDLEDEALANYVNHLIDGWSDSAARFDAPLVWAVDYGLDTGGTEDITTLMRSAVAQKVYEKLKGDAETKDGVRFVDGSVEPAGAEALLQGLAGRPGLIVTTSHGQIGASETLGLPVDQTRRAVPLESLVEAWQPDGAIWYSHACCSAGSDSRSVFDGLFDAEAAVAKELSGVAALGSQVAPLPRRLLGAAKPLRAFIGHVEPTFDWTLQDPDGTGVPRTHPLLSALYEHLYLREPLAFGFRDWWSTVGSLKTIKQRSALLRARGAGRPEPRDSRGSDRRNPQGSLRCATGSSSPSLRPSRFSARAEPHWRPRRLR
jgi:hypothetical protein